MQVRPPPVLTVKIPALRPTRQGRPALGEGPGTPPQLIHPVQRPRLLLPIPSEVLWHVGQQPQEQDGNQETRQKKRSLDECHVLPLTPSAGHVLAPRKPNHALPTSWDVTNLFAMSRLPQVIWQGECERLGGCSHSTRKRFRPPAGRASRSRPLHCLPSAAAPRPRVSRMMVFQPGPQFLHRGECDDLEVVGHGDDAMCLNRRCTTCGGMTHVVHPLGSRHYECVSDD
jgi:hypothetical protein